MAEPRPAAFRVSVVRAGQLAEEAVLDSGAPVATPPEAPTVSTWFARTRGGFAVRLREGLAGWVDLGRGPTVDVATLAGRAFGPRTLRLPPTARGVLRMGDTLVVFRPATVPAARAAVPVRLPRAMRGGLFSGADRLFARTLAASVVLSSTAAFALSRHEVLEVVGDEEIPLVVREFILPLPKPPPEPVRLPEVASISEPAAQSPSPPRPAPAPLSPEDLRTAVETIGILGPAGAPAAFGDLLGPGTEDESIAVLLDDATASPTIRAAPGTLRGDLHGTVAGIGPLVTAGTPGAPAIANAPRDAPVTVETPEPPAVDSRRITPAAVAARVRERLPAIRACYERELKRQPTMSGRLVVAFSIGPGGRVAGTAIDADEIGDAQVARCVATVLRGTTFPFDPPEDVPVSYPFVFAAAGS
jgi:hypothetical protein